jgi:hypothetical protein
VIAVIRNSILKADKRFVQARIADKSVDVGLKQLIAVRYRLNSQSKTFILQQVSCRFST